MADITAVETAEIWLYLAVILDVFSLLVIGWTMAASKDEQLVELARLVALANRRPHAEWVHHSDLGLSLLQSAIRLCFDKPE